MKPRILLCGILLTAAFPFHAGAGTLFYVPIPATGSDAQSGIDPARVYTNAVAAGNVKAAGRTVNGVPLAALSGSGANSCTANGVTLSAATGTLINGGGKSATILADGATSDLLAGMIFNDGARDGSEQYAVLDPATLTVGKTYDLRVYVCNASGENRQVNLTFAGDGKPAVSTDFFNEDDATTSAGGFIEPNQVYYISYRFTWDGASTPGFTATQRFGSTPFCLYALTNQEVGDGDARPAGALVAAEPEPIAAAPTSRGTRTTYVNTDEDIGVTSEVFYGSDSLRDNGRWVTVGKYGRCWHPTRVDEDWQPYTRGHWVYSRDDGWVWDSDEDFGWATYHYGRWFREEDSGWYWVPGRVWAPAWVSWRHGHSYVGWAPLPPVALAVAGIGISAWADHRWNIGPRAYNFVNARDFGARSMAQVLIPRAQNPAIMTNTNNVTNIVSGRRGIYNGGPSYQAVSNALVRTGSQPIPSVSVTRNAGTRPVTGNGRPSQVLPGVLAIAAPTVTRSKKPGSLPPVASAIATPKFDNGWNGLTDPKHAAALQAKIANETPGATAKTAPARLPGSHVSAPVGSGATAPLKAFRPGKPTATTLIQPGQPATSAGTALLRPGQPVNPTVTIPTQPGQPLTAGTGGLKKHGNKPTPAAVPVPLPGQPSNPALVAPAQPAQPTNPAGVPFTKPGQRVKPTAVAPASPMPGVVTVKPNTPSVSAPEPSRGKKNNPKPGMPAITPPAPVPAAIAVKPTTPSAAVPEPVRPKKHTPQPSAPVPSPFVAPVTPRAPMDEPARPKKHNAPIAAPAAPVPAPAPVARPAARPEPVAQPRHAPAPVIQPRPEPVAQPRHAPAPVIQPRPEPVAQPRHAPAPVVQPRPAPAPAPVIQPRPAPAPAPAPPAGHPGKGGKPTPTPPPGVNG